MIFHVNICNIQQLLSVKMFVPKNTYYKLQDILKFKLIKFKNMKRAFKFFGETIKSCNVFVSPVNLRYQLDPDYNTFAGGCVSIGLLILLMSVFFNAWVQLLSKQAISSSTQTIREFDPQYMSVQSDDFMFAVGITGLNFSDVTQKKFFILKFTKTYVINGTKNRTKIILQTCGQKHWQKLGQQFVQTYRREQLSSYLCMPLNYTMEIGGKYTSQKFIYYKLSFQKCTGSNCRSQAQIDNWILDKTAFNFNFYYANTLINADQKKPLSNFFEDKDYTMFSSTMGTQTNLYLGEYIMTTDQSILPTIDQQVQSGFILNRGEKQTWNYIITPTQSYSKLYLRKSNTRIQIHRKFRKIDDMLSYIGGLFGIVSVVFGFVMNYYGQCSFELQMCQKIFDYHNKKDNSKMDQTENNLDNKNQQINLNNQTKNGDGWGVKQQKERQNQKIIEPKDFGFIDFFLHVIYIFLKKLRDFEWRRMEIYEESLEQMRYKLDVSQLLEKLSFYDRSITTLFDESQLKLLYLQEKHNFKEVREQREMLCMKTDIIAKLFGMANEDPSKIQDDTIVQQKNTLEQMATRKSRKKLKTLIGKPPNVNIFQIFAQAGLKSAQSQNQINLPPQIKKALEKLQERIQSGDEVSVRIYNGLQYDLLEAFERGKLKKKYNFVPKKSTRKKEENFIAQQIQKGQGMMINQSSPGNSGKSLERFVRF